MRLDSTILPQDSRFINLTGHQFGKLTVISYAGNSFPYKKFWHCKCECGKKTISLGASLRNGDTKSCGCLIKHLTHGYGNNKNAEYRTWQGIKKRCYNPKGHNYNLYGGRGIIMCDRWLENFSNFLKDMGFRPSVLHSIDRINNNGNYEPSNCRWATKTEQQNNKSSNVRIRCNGSFMSIAEAAVIMGLSYNTLYNRYWKSANKKRFECFN